MSAYQPRTAVGEAAMAAIIEHPSDTLLALDFDGTLAPIVEDPEQAHADSAAVDALAGLGRLLGRIVLITGRSARAAVRLGGFRDRAGLDSLIVLGQYGVERWDAATDTSQSPDEPEVIGAVKNELRSVLEACSATAARIEHKGRAIAVHTRGLDDPEEMLRRLSRPLADLAHRHGLVVEPGRQVLEIRAPGMDKGKALRGIVAETGARQVIFAGDDLGDLPAFHVVQQLRDQGVPGLLVCSSSTEEKALEEVSDLLVDGPAGVAAWLTDLAEAIMERRQRGQIASPPAALDSPHQQGR
jgi:trehalose 6-phosphate phosphatase